MIKYIFLYKLIQNRNAIRHQLRHFHTHMYPFSFFIYKQKKILDLKEKLFFLPLNSKYFHKRLCSEFCDENDDDDDAVIVVR